jgi:golgin subfamily B member 1
MPATAAELASIIDRLRSGRLVLCAGPRLGGNGLSDVVRGLLKRVSNGAEARSLADAQPLAVAGWLRRRLGVSIELTEFVQDREPPEALRLLAELPFRAVVTTTFGDVMVKAFARNGKVPRVYTPRDTSPERSAGERYVFKALGDASRPDTLVLGAEDLGAAAAGGGYRVLTEELFPQKSFLIVGFAPGDADLGILLERVLFGVRADDAEHFAVLPGLSSIEREELEASLKIKVLDVEDAAALARALRAELGDDPSLAVPDEDDLEGWLSLLREDPDRVDAVVRLDRIERKLVRDADHEKLVEYYLGRSEVEPSPNRRVELLVALAQLFDRELGDLDRAFTVLLSAHKQAPRRDLWDDLERLADYTGRLAELEAELVESLPQLPLGDQPGAWARLARLRGDRLDRWDEAVYACDRALALDPDEPDAKERRFEMLKRSSRWEEAAASLAGRAAVRANSPEERATMFVELAELHEVKNPDPGAALKAYRRALEVDPTNEQARMGIETLLRRKGEHGALLKFLDDRGQNAGSDDERYESRREAAHLCAMQGDRPEAIRRYEELRAEHPGDLEVLRELEKLYQDDGRIREYLDILQAQVGLVEDVRERAGLYRRMASDWEEKLGSRAQAEECLEWLLTFDPNSEDAYEALERMYRADERWRAAVDVYCRHAAVAEPGRKGDLFMAIARLYEHQIRDDVRAVEYYLNAEEALGEPDDALEALTRCYKRLDQGDRAVEVLLRRVERATTIHERLALLHEAGDVTLNHVGDAEGAEKLFQRALDADPTHVPSILALSDLLRRKNEVGRAAKLLEQAILHTSDRALKARLLVEAGELEEKRESTDAAILRYREVLEHDAEHLEANVRLASLLWDSGRHEEAIPLLETLARIQPDPEIRGRHLLQLARSFLATGNRPRARRAYARAAELDTKSLEAMKGNADCLFADEEWAEARSSYSTVLEHHEEDLLYADRADVYSRLGTCALKLGDKTEARMRLAQALAIDPQHRPSLLVKLELDEHSPEALIAAKRAFLPAAPLAEKVQILCEIGDVCLGKLEDPVRAIQAYREALQIEPENHRLLHRLLDVYVEQKAWIDALAALRRLVEREPVASVRARYRHAAGMIYRDELDEVEEALKHLKAALTDDPSLTRASEAIEQILGAEERWVELEKHYADTLKKLGPEADDGRNGERLRLWSALGELCLSKLNQVEHGIAALEVATHLDGSPERHDRLAALYARVGQHGKAIAAHHMLLRADKRRLESYRELAKLYLATGDTMRARACSDAVSFLEKGTCEKPPRGKGGQPLTPDMWQRLMHPDEDRLLSALFPLVTPLIAASQARSQKPRTMAKKDLVSPDDGRTFMKVLKMVVGAFAMPLPEVHARDDQEAPAAIVTYHARDALIPALLVGRPLLHERRTRDEMLFDLTRQLVQLRQACFLRLILPDPRELALLVETAMAIASNSAEKSAAPPVAQTLAGLRQGLTPAVLDQVAQIGARLRAQNARAERATANWIRATDLTATRAAFVLLGDLATCGRLIAAEPATPMTVPADQRVADLVWSTVTDDLFAVRKHLGLLA